jgi:hypothetical protein
MYFHSDDLNCALGPKDVEMLHRVFERTCFLAGFPKLSKRGNQLARFLIDEFRVGHTDEACLLECALWFTKRDTRQSEFSSRRGLGEISRVRGPAHE